jgi:phage terminase small subunit
MALTAKQSAFVDEYLVDLNGTQAAIRAGYSAKTANEQASRLLANVSLQESIQEAMAQRSKRVQRTADDVLADLALIKADAMKIVADRDGNMVMIDRPSAIKTLELEGRHRAMWTDKSEITGKDGAALIVEIVRYGDVSKL